MRKITISILILLTSFLVFPGQSFALERHALVIGNSDYEGIPLLNPRNDAIDMAKQLSAMGYQVHNGGPLLDLDQVGIERAIRAFAQQLPEEANALFYFAGHGMDSQSDNYLIPINHNLAYETQLRDRAVSVRSIVELFTLANPKGINVFLLDACRDSPLKSSVRSTRQGLTRLSDIPRGVFVGYAADSGQTAEDGLGRNGTYTGELLNVMRESPEVIIEIAHKKVAERVYQKTDGRQFPVSENKIYGNWCFGACNELPEKKLALPTLSVDGEQPASSPSKIDKRWVAAGAVAVALIAGLISQDGEPPPEEENFVIRLTPP